MEKMHIMIVEDDETLAREIKDFLMRWGYYAVIATHFENIVEDFYNYKPHLILMDINLPYYDGFYWCTQIRNTSQVPLIFISSRNDDHDKIRAILQGGDDYVDKPFHLELLKAKIEAILRRTYQYKVKDQMRINADIYYDKTKGSLFYHEHEIHLTKSESMRTLPVALHLFQTDYGVEWGALSAASVISIFPIVAIFLILQKYFVQGMTAGTLSAS